MKGKKKGNPARRVSVPRHATPSLARGSRGGRVAVSSFRCPKCVVAPPKGPSEQPGGLQTSPSHLRGALALRYAHFADLHFVGKKTAAEECRRRKGCTGITPDGLDDAPPLGGCCTRDQGKGALFLVAEPKGP